MVIGFLDILYIISALLLTLNNFNLSMNKLSHSKMWDEITYLFINFNDRTVDAREWINNSISYSIVGLITYPLWDYTGSTPVVSH